MTWENINQRPRLATESEIKSRDSHKALTGSVSTQQITDIYTVTRVSITWATCLRTKWEKLPSSHYWAEQTFVLFRARCDNWVWAFIHQNIRMCHRKMSDCLALWLFFWHHFLFMRYSIRNRICWEEFVNSLVIRFHCFYQRSNGGVEMSDMHACGFLPVMMRHWIPDSLTLALLLVLSQTGFKPLFDSFFRARRSLSKLMTYKKLMQHASVIIFRWASRREL